MPVDHRPVLLTSVQNPRIKKALALRSAQERRARNSFVVEGAREIDRALSSAFFLQELFVCEAQLSPLAIPIVQKIGISAPELLTLVNDTVMHKLLVRTGSDGLFAVFKSRSQTLADLRLGGAPLLLAVEDLEKPGNLGALIRSADGAGCHAVICLGQTVDTFNPLVIRTSLGTVFHVPVINAQPAELHTFCQQYGIKIYAAALTDTSQVYHQMDLTGARVILIGSEAHGLSDYWLKTADKLVKIPMLGLADSLNAATAGAVLVYEAQRQRQVVNGDW